MAQMSEAEDTGRRWPDLAGRIEGSGHVLPVRIYYEDTDFSGAVYHANYLRYCERGRSDFLRLIGVHHHELHAADDLQERLGFVVTQMNSAFHKPARIDDVIEVWTRFTGLGGARFELRQEVWRGEETLFSADLKAALVDGRGRPKRLPREMRERFEAYVQSS